MKELAMDRSSLLLRAVVVSAAGALLACASVDDNYHFSQISGERYFRTPIDTYRVSIVKVDGKSNTFKPALVDPGLRQITVQGPPGGALGNGLERTLALEVAPCTRYYLVAVKENRLQSDFDIRVDYQEPVPGCTPPRSS
jgi:hypothetical protein